MSVYFTNKATADRSVIAFINPDYDNEPKLSSGPIETKFFSSLDEEKDFTVQVIDEENATTKRFLELKKESLDDAILHLSCHGSGAQIDPRSCRLFFSHDETVELPEILQKPEFGLTELVFLSACESGLRSRYVIDEAVSLNSAFLYLGAGNTVTSLWMVSDFLSAEFTRLFYTLLSEFGDINLCYRKACTKMKEAYGDNAAHIWSGYQLWESMS